MSTPMLSVEPTPELEAYWQALLDAIRIQGANIDVVVLLAITAKLVGRLVAMQDQRKYNSATVMAMVASNIQAGNMDVVNDLLMNTGGHA